MDIREEKKKLLFLQAINTLELYNFKEARTLLSMYNEVINEKSNESLQSSK